MEVKTKLKTNIIKSKKQISKYQMAIIIAIIGIIITTIVQLALSNENEAYKNNLLSQNFVGISDIDVDKIPRLPEGFEAVNFNKENDRYEIIKNVYSEENFKKWNNEYFAVKDETVWKWLPAFKYKIVYYKDDQIIASATYSKAFDKNNNEIEFKNLDTKIAEANKFKYEITDKDSNDTTYSLHQAFLKDGYKSNGIWISYKDAKIDTKKYKNYSEIYDYSKNISKILNKEGKEDHDASIMNTMEYGALKIAKQDDLFFKLKDNTKKEIMLGYLDGGNLENGSEIANDVKNNDIKYPRAKNNTAEENYIEASLDGTKYGDGFSDTKGRINKENEKTNIDKNKFLTKENPFFILEKDEGKKELNISSTNGDVSGEESLGIRLIIRSKSIDAKNKINFTFMPDEGSSLIKDGKEITNFKYSHTKGGLITKEKMESFKLKCTKTGYKFVRWEPDPTANIYYEDQVFKPIFEKENESENPTNSVARFYFDYSGDAEYMDITGNIGDRITKEQVKKVEEKMKEKGLEVINWAPDYTDKKFTKGMQKYYPKIKRAGSFEEKEIYFTFYANDKKEQWITIKAKFKYSSGQEMGISPNEIPDLKEKLANLKIGNDSTDVFDGWNISLDKKQIADTEYIPRFKPQENPKPEPEKEKVVIYVDYNGSKIAPQREMKYTINKGTSIKDNPSVYNQMMDERHLRPNFELSPDKTKWYNQSLDKPINETTTFKLLWIRSQINVRFWNAPKDYKGKKIISNQKVPAGTAAKIPDKKLVLPYYEITNPLTGYKYKRTFNAATGWRPSEIYEPIAVNSLGVNKIDGKYVMDVYPVFENAYNDPRNKVNLRFNLNEPKGESGNIYYPDKEFFKDRKMDKGSVLYSPDSSDLPRLAGYRFKGFSPKLPLKMDSDKVVTLLWEKNQVYTPWNPGSDNDDDENGGGNSGSINWRLPDKNEKGKSKKKPGIFITDKKGGKKRSDKKRKVNVKAGLKTNKNIIIIGAILTTIIIFSYTRIRYLNKKVKRNEEELKSIW